MLRFASLLGLLACSALVGCVAPATNYRYTGLVPAPRPIAWDGRAAQAGTLRLDGTIDNVAVEENIAPQIHDTALRVAQWSAEGSAMIAVSDEVEVGLRAEWHSYDWSAPSAVGTMPLPSAPNGWGLGPEIRIAVPFDDAHRFVLGLAGNIMRYEVPYAEWKLGSCASSPTCTSTLEGSYQLFDEESESHLVYSFGAYPSIGLGKDNKYGHVFGMIGATNGFQNDGFTNSPTNGSSIDLVGPLWIVGGGYGASFEAFHVSAMAFLPLTESTSPVDYGMGFQLTLGVNVDLWTQDSTRD